MLNVKFSNNITFFLTDDAMETMIEDKSNPNKTEYVTINNLGICSLYERGKEFCFTYAPKNNGVIFLEAELFDIKCAFYKNGDINIAQISKHGHVAINYNMIAYYYNNIICNIMLKEKMDNGTEFIDDDRRKDIEKTIKTS
jgi:hypothetical protein